MAVFVERKDGQSYIRDDGEWFIVDEVGRLIISDSESRTVVIYQADVWAAVEADK